VALGLFLAVHASAAITPCGSPPGPALSGYGPTDGCATIDYTFSNFTVSTPGTSQVINGITIPAPPYTHTVAATGIFLTLSASDPSLVSLRSPGPDAGAPLTNNCDQNSGNGGWCVQDKNQILVNSVVFSMQANVGDIPFAGFSGTIISHANNAAAVAFLEICAGPNAPTVWGAGNDCAVQNPGAVYSVLQAGTVVGNFNQIDFFNAVAVGVPQIYIRETIYLTTDNGGGSWATLVNLDIIDAPEPATFLLVGVGLVGLGIFRRRRRLS
jgi:hypothetical protein